MEKASDAFRTISEAAEDLDLPQHVLRFWETKFNQIRPMKRGGGRRYYRPDDLELLRGIQYLLYGEGYTIKGVQRILKEQGVRFVMEIWRHPGEPIPTQPGDIGEETESGDDSIELADDDGRDGPEAVEPEFEREPHVHGEAPAVPVPTVEEAMEGEMLPSGILPEGVTGRPAFRFMERFRGTSAPTSDVGHGGANLSKEDIRRLQATLFELLECKRLLDQTR